MSMASVIWLHGLGDTGAGWSALGRMVNDKHPSWRFSFPTAAERPVTLYGNMLMTAWMDLDDLPVTLETPDDEPGYVQSAKVIHGLIDAELARGTPANRIFLGGFSQGAAMSVFAGLTYPKPLGGVCVVPALREPPRCTACRAPATIVMSTSIFKPHAFHTHTQHRLLRLAPALGEAPEVAHAARDAAAHCARVARRQGPF